MKDRRQARRQWVSKFVSGWCATGKMMNIWKQSLTALCPRYNQAVEDNLHILKCLSDRSMDVWDKSVVKVKEWLDSNGTCPDLRSLIVQILHNWKRGEIIELKEDSDFEGTPQVYRTQKIIGRRLSTVLDTGTTEVC